LVDLVFKTPLFLVYDKIHEISPNLLVCDNLVYLNENDFSLQDEFNYWFDSLV